MNEEQKNQVAEILLDHWRMSDRAYKRAAKELAKAKEKGRKEAKDYWETYMVIEEGKMQMIDEIAASLYIELPVWFLR